MALPTIQTDNFQTLCRAIKNDDVCLLECTDQQGTMVPTICIAQWDGDTMNMTPIAMMFTVDPFTLLTPPA